MEKDENLGNEINAENNNDNKKSKKGLIIGIVVALIAIMLVIVVVILSKDDSKKDNLKDSNEIKEEQEKDEENESDDEFSEEDEKIDEDEIPEEEYVGEVARSEYGGYYVISDNGSYHLKRNEKEVAKIEKGKLSIYKDKNDKNSKYISVYCQEGCSFAEVADKYGYLKNFDSTSIIYDINTGKYKIFNDGYVNLILGNNAIHFTFESIQENDYYLAMIDKNGDIKKLPSGIRLMGDGSWIAVDTPCFSRSSKYIVVKTEGEHTDGRYGLYDYDLNKKIDVIYDDLVTISDDLLIAKKNNKYGIINSSNKTIIDFKYDGIEAIDNYYVVLLNDKIGVIDKDGKEIIPINYTVYKQDFSLRLCCGQENIFEVGKTDENQIVISYVDVSKKDEDSRYGYGYSYLILNNDNTYKKVDNIE